MEEKERKKFCNSLRKLSIRAGKIARGFFDAKAREGCGRISKTAQQHGDELRQGVGQCYRGRRCTGSKQSGLERGFGEGPGCCGRRIAVI